jgi:hypothetical protein
MCCGRPQSQASTGQQGPAKLFVMKPRQTGPAQSPPTPKPPALFEYVGETALTVVSPITRKTYRFAKPGAQVEVDPRDRSWIAFVPNLARASAPVQSR